MIAFLTSNRRSAVADLTKLHDLRKFSPLTGRGVIRRGDRLIPFLIADRAEQIQGQRLTEIATLGPAADPMLYRLAAPMVR